MAFHYDYPRPALTADALVYHPVQKEILLIERKNEPFYGKWALLGGFVEEHEEPYLACIRELKEETNLDFKGKSENLIGVFGKKGRDPRGWTVSASYFFEVDKEESLRIKAGSDSAQVKWFSLDELPELAFDHLEMIEKALGN